MNNLNYIQTLFFVQNQSFRQVAWATPGSVMMLMIIYGNDASQKCKLSAMTTGQSDGRVAVTRMSVPPLIYF